MFLNVYPFFFFKFILFFCGWSNDGNREMGNVQSGTLRRSSKVTLVILSSKT